MKIVKRHLTELKECYAVGTILLNGRNKLIFASEGYGPCYIFDTEDFSRHTIWKKPGGAMSVVPVPGKDGEFLAVQNFFPTFQSKEAKIVWVKYLNRIWKIKKVLSLPYIHRFDVIRVNDLNYFIGATLCTTKSFKDDWSDPGKVYVGVLPDDWDQEMEVKPILENLTKNHGYCRGIWNDRMASFVSSEQGVYVLKIPIRDNNEWEIEKIIDRPVSDLAICDIDRDGNVEIATIEPFHGDKYLISKLINDAWVKVYEYKNTTDFLHVVWGGMIRGRRTFIGGGRRFDQELFMVQYENGIFNTTLIDEKIGPSNVAVINGGNRDLIISANRDKGEAAVYVVTDD